MKPRLCGRGEQRSRGRNISKGDRPGQIDTGKSFYYLMFSVLLLLISVRERFVCMCVCLYLCMLQLVDSY